MEVFQLGDAVIFFDPIYEEHLTGIGHPERPERLLVSLDALEESGLLERVKIVSPRDAAIEEIKLVHSSRYINEVREVADSGGGHLDMDTAVSPASYRAALKAAGALVQSVDDCLEGKYRRTFCLVRPPGHHALPTRGMGFCIFNNVAIGARYAIAKKRLERVMIVDWDAHHGNGTQDVFYEDPSVLYVSLHQYPHYPGSGWVDETGSGAGSGYTINFPFPPGTGEEHYLEAFERVIVPAGKKFAPDLIMVSDGYDSHAGDLLCSMRLTDTSYSKMIDYTAGLADEFCDGRLIVTIEGGYNLTAMAHSVVQTVSGLAGVDIPGKDGDAQPTVHPEKARAVIEQAAALHGA